MNDVEKADIWGVAYQGMNDPSKKATFIKNVEKFRDVADPDIVEIVRNTVKTLFNGDAGTSVDKLAEVVVDIALHESSGFKHRKQMGGGPARGIHQVEPATAFDLIKSSAFLGVKAKAFLKERGLDISKELSKAEIEAALLNDEVSTVFATAKLLTASAHHGLIGKLK